MLGSGASVSLDHSAVAACLTSDELNIFGVAKYIRQVANEAVKLNVGSLPNTKSSIPKIDLKAYSNNSRLRQDDNIKEVASEYTSRAWDGRLSTGWASFVFEAFKDI